MKLGNLDYLKKSQGQNKYSFFMAAGVTVRLAGWVCLSVLSGSKSTSTPCVKYSLPEEKKVQQITNTFKE